MVAPSSNGGNVEERFVRSLTEDEKASINYEQLTQILITLRDGSLEAKQALLREIIEIINTLYPEGSERYMEVPESFREFLVSSESGPAPNVGKKTRGPRRPATPIVAKGKLDAPVRADIVNYEITLALRRPDMYKQYPDAGMAEYSGSFGKNKDGRLIVTINTLEGEGFDQIITAINTLGDDCVDTYLAIMKIAIDKNGTENIRLPFLISPDDILAVRGKKKMHGSSYTAHQRAEVTAHLKTLSQTRIIATMYQPGGGRRRKVRTVVRAEGAIIDLLSGKIGEYSTITGEVIWEKRSVALGEWITMIPELNHMTAPLLDQILAYSAKNEVYQKRLGFYFTYMFRVNAAKGCAFTRSMKAVLEGAGITPPREVGKFRDAIEHALADLKQANVIGEYARIVDASLSGKERESQVREHARGWWDIYEHMQWRFTAPLWLKDQYKGLLREAKSDANS
jgi:hypothetical protein